MLNIRNFAPEVESYLRGPRGGHISAPRELASCQPQTIATKFNFSPVFPLMYICGSEPPTVGLSIRLLLKYIYGSDYSLYLMYFSGSNHPCLSDMHVKLLIIFMVRFEQGHEGGEIEVSSLRWRISVSYRFTIITVYCRRK